MSDVPEHLSCSPSRAAAVRKRPVAAALPQVSSRPTERGIYAWIAEGSSALVHVHTRPTDHSPGNVLNGSLIRNCPFYDGCAIEQWSGGTWYGSLKHPAVPQAPVADAARAEPTTTVLPDGSAFTVGSLPLPKEHWLYAPRC